MAYNAGKNLTKLCVEEKNYITGGFVKENSYSNQIIHTSPPPRHLKGQMFGPL